MKIIDLLNKIANGEEVPKEFIWDDRKYYLQSDKCYKCDETSTILEEDFIVENLNDEIEIIEEENKKCTVETCCIGIEGLSKTLLKIKDDMQSIYENIDEVEILEEEKKIPKKLPYYDYSKIISSNDKLKTIELMLEKHEIRLNDNWEKINEIIDTLEMLNDKIK